MSKSNTARRQPAAKKNSVPRSIDEYLATVPEPARSTLSKLRATIRSAAPADTVETISYKMPAFKHQGILVWFAAFSNHCSLFPTAAVVAALKDDLKSYVTSKGTIQFPADKPLPSALVKKIVCARVARVEGKKPR